jgi:hypothetical protein
MESVGKALHQEIAFRRLIPPTLADDPDLKVHLAAALFDLAIFKLAEKSGKDACADFVESIRLFGELESTDSDRFREALHAVSDRFFAHLHRLNFSEIAAPTAISLYGFLRGYARSLPPGETFPSDSQLEDLSTRIAAAANVP